MAVLASIQNLSYFSPIAYYIYNIKWLINSHCQSDVFEHSVLTYWVKEKKKAME